MLYNKGRLYFYIIIIQKFTVLNCLEVQAKIVYRLVMFLVEVAARWGGDAVLDHCILMLSFLGAINK